MSMLADGMTGVLGSGISPALKDDTFFLARGGKNNLGIPAGINPDRIVEGDITKPLCGISPENLARLKKAGIDRYFHLAANVSFAVTDENHYIWEVNFTGTLNALVLAKELGVKEFLHCSTSFAPDCRNHYECSKMAAEELVVNSGMRYMIFRPSAMVGHSQTGYTSGFNGYYGVFDFFYLTAVGKRGENQGMIVNLPVWVICSSTSTINLIPLDWVVYTMLALLKKPANNQIYHLAHDNPPNCKHIMALGFEILGISGIQYLEGPVTEEEEDRLYQGVDISASVRSKVHEIFRRYTPYVTRERRFLSDTTREALGAEFREPPPITDDLIARLLNFAVEKNFGHLRRRKSAIRPEPVKTIGNAYPLVAAV